MLERLYKYWVYGGFLAGLTLFALCPLILPAWPETLRLTFLALPIYMVHQYEEHDADRFRTWFNQTLGKGLELLTPVAVFVINIPVVWGFICIACYLCAFVNPGLGLIAIYMLLVNGIGHTAQAIISKRYNPGLGSSILVFLPFSIFGIVQFGELNAGGWRWNMIALAVSIISHVAIILYATARRRRLLAA